MIPLLCCTATAQLKHFTLEDLLPGGKTYQSTVPENQKLAWWGDKLVKIDGDSCLVYEKKVWKPLFDLPALNAALQEAGLEKQTNLNVVKFPYSGQSLAHIHTSGYDALYHWNTHKLEWKVTHTSGISYEEWSPVSRSLAYNRENNLYVLTADGKEHQVSNDGSRDLVYGQSVHRNEFGINKGTFWSPDGQYLCFYKMDQSMVTDYPLVDISTRIATLTPIKYPMAGEKSHKVSVGVYSVQTGKTVWLQTGDNTDQYYCGITWSPDSKKLFLYNLNRDQNDARLLQFDAGTGNKERMLDEETNPKYVEPEHGLTFLPWDADKFIYWSEKDGFAHLYLYSLKEGKTLRKITDGRCGEVIELSGFNKKTKSVIIIGTGLSPIQHNLFSVSVEHDKMQLLDSGKGVHQAVLSSDGSQLVDYWSAPDVARNIDLIQTATKKKENLLTAENPLKDFDMPEVTCGTIKAADGATDLYYRLVKPVDFDPNKKYPTIVYVYGGPHVRMVDSSLNYASRGWELYMAQKGYVVFVLDNRGSSERGLAFENVVFRHLGTEEMKDQMKGVEFLKSLPYVDANRLGVHGWSFGGFMTVNMMLTYPEVFKCAVAGGPVIDWGYYEVMYGERYMDTPQTNPEGYKGNNLNLRAGNLKGRLLVVFGYNDPVCVPQQTLSFIRSCETAGTHPDLFTYPGDGHNMYGRDRIHLHEHITNYFEDYLK